MANNFKNDRSVSNIDIAKPHNRYKYNGNHKSIGTGV